MSFIINLFLSCFSAIVMNDIGYGVTTWQWWVVLLSIALNYINGREYENKRWLKILEER